MKFGREFKRSMVPEWTDAYMDYKGLKRILKEIKLQKQSTEQPSTPSKSSLHGFSIYRSFSGLTRRQSSSFSSDGDIEDQVVPVKKDEQGGPKSKNFFRPKILKDSPGGETEILFFEKMDEELSKVNRFYMEKVEEVMTEAESLNKQMNALVALRLKVACPDLDGSSSQPCNTNAQGN